MDEAKKTVLEKALKDITKRYGEGSIMRLGQAKHMAVDAIPTGSLSLDIAPGCRRHSPRPDHRNLWAGILR